jgi:hypothetical protein
MLAIGIERKMPQAQQIQSIITPCSQVPHPHNPHWPNLVNFFPKLRDSFFRWSTTPLVLSAAAGRIKVKRSCWHPRVAHHPALRWLPPFSGRPCGWGAASIPPQRSNAGGAKLGKNWGIVGIRTTCRPNRSSGVCSAIPLDWTCRSVMGMGWMIFLFPRGMVPWKIGGVLGFNSNILLLLLKRRRQWQQERRGLQQPPVRRKMITK